METGKGKAQVALEYLILTAVMLAAVIIIFAFAYVQYEGHVKTVKASDALNSMVSAADEVYLLGEGNNRFEEVSFPSGLAESNWIQVLNICSDGTTQTCATGDCSCPDDTNFSALQLTFNLWGEETTMRKKSKAKLSLAAFPSAQQASGGAFFTMKVSWNGEKVEIRNVD